MPISIQSYSVFSLTALMLLGCDSNKSDTMPVTNPNDHGGKYTASSAPGKVTMLAWRNEADDDGSWTALDPSRACESSGYCEIDVKKPIRWFMVCERESRKELSIFVKSISIDTGSCLEAGRPRRSLQSLAEDGRQGTEVEVSGTSQPCLLASASTFGNHLNPSTCPGKQIVELDPNTATDQILGIEYDGNAKAGREMLLPQRFLMLRDFSIQQGQKVDFSQSIAAKHTIFRRSDVPAPEANLQFSHFYFLQGQRVLTDWGLGWPLPLKIATIPGSTMKSGEANEISFAEIHSDKNGLSQKAIEFYGSVSGDEFTFSLPPAFQSVSLAVREHGQHSFSWVLEDSDLISAASARFTLEQFIVSEDSKQIYELSYHVPAALKLIRDFSANIPVQVFPKELNDFEIFNDRNRTRDIQVRVESDMQARTMDPTLFRSNVSVETFVQDYQVLSE